MHDGDPAHRPGKSTLSQAMARNTPLDVTKCAVLVRAGHKRRQRNVHDLNDYPGTPARLTTF
jgi:hypothetical protein